MKIVIQRVSKASVTVEGEMISSINKGLHLLVCLESGDGQKQISEAAAKIKKLRIFPDEKGRMNLDLSKAQGEILAISQFTLSWDGRKGNRPSFDRSMEPKEANNLFENFCSILREDFVVKTGSFGAHMDCEIHNDGPVTFCFSF